VPSEVLKFKNPIALLPVASIVNPDASAVYNGYHWQRFY